ncbi:hypothetical protein F5Y13DRAFT_187532 [Hypoxylon sp. FL1857]|nr:hypothetical protein F5Y13DRAFT_187532 [Hypoxylon sp. FL1857]
MKASRLSSKSIISAYIGCISRRQWNQIPSYFAANANWWINGNPARNPQAGDGSVASRLLNVQSLADNFDTYSLDILNIVAERDSVVAEVMGTGRGPLDLVYVNNVTMSFVLDRDGKIASLREYPDFNELNWVLQWFHDHGISGNSTHEIVSR